MELKSRRMVRARGAVIGVSPALFVLLVLSVIGACQSDPAAGRGGTSKEDVVTSYIAALEKGDAALMKRLVHPSMVDVDPDVAARIARQGGAQIWGMDVQYRILDGSSGAVATVTGIRNGQPYRDVLMIGTADRRWYLNLGHGGPPADTSIPTADTPEP